MKCSDKLGVRGKVGETLCPLHRMPIPRTDLFMDILVPEAELAERKQTWQPVKRDLTGWLARYRKLVTNASQGGILSV